MVCQTSRSRSSIADLANPTEHAEQVAFFEQAAYLLSADQYDLLWATPNGGFRHISTANMLKLEGVKSGVPDICFAFPVAPYHGLFIEMKRRKKGSVSETQSLKMGQLSSVGYRCAVCRGCDEALSELQSYLKGDQ